MHTAVKASGPPPEPTRERVSPWASVAKDCREAPNEWFTAAGEHAPSVATYLRREWGLEVRTVDKRMVQVGDKEAERCTLWIRWTLSSQAYADQLAAAREEGGGEPDEDQAEALNAKEEAEKATDGEGETGTWATDDDETDWEGAIVNPGPGEVPVS